MNKTGFVIYHKSFLIRKGLADVIDKIPNSNVLLQIDNEDELIESIEQRDFDILIVNRDILLNKDFNKQIKQLDDIQIISIGNHNPDHAQHNKNISEHIDINDTQKVILQKINNVIGNNTSNKKKTPKLEEISSREADILKHVALGLSNKEIADKLFLSTHTVVTHRKNITRKLGIKTVPGLTIYAILNNIIDINDTESI